MNPLAIRTSIDRCVLREWRETDIASLARHANNRNVSRFLLDQFPFPYTERDARDWIATATAKAKATETHGMHLAIEIEGEAAGGIGAAFGEGNARATAAIGYWIGEAHWGGGIATAAVRAFAEHLLAEHTVGPTAIDRLEATVFANNPASIRVLAKAGFAREIHVDDGGDDDGGDGHDDNDATAATNLGVRFVRLRNAGA
jgi:RimJ/RimL family protein N-acetyltransferase